MVGAAKTERREVPADLFEATPAGGGLGHWVLAAPLLVFVAWAWVDLFAYVSPLPWYWLDAIVALALLLLLMVLPAGWVAHWVITAAPRLFQNAGWDVQPLEPVREAEQYLVHYVIRQRHRAANTWSRAWVRAAQGWVYIEIAVILGGGIVMIPLFFSAAEFGFGR